MKNPAKVIVVIGAGSIGQAIARRVSAGKHVVLADLKQENADAAAKVLLDAGFNVTTAVVDGALQVTVSATDVDGPSQNRLRELRFGQPLNGRIELAGQSQTAAHTYAVPTVTDRVTFAVRRVTPGQPTTVPLTVVDECGAWPTFVGGGANAGF